MALLSIRIVTVDYYQSSPLKGYDSCLSEFRKCEIYSVPVLRVFGSTPAGQKSIVHVHNVFPYLTVEWEDAFPGDKADDPRTCELKLAIEIEKCLNSKFNSSTRHHVYDISTVKRKSIYGYHPEDKGFLRIFLYSPRDVQKLADLLNNGTIFDRFIQPYDAHVSYVAQFMIDYNLYGMNFLNLSKFEFRPTTDFYSTSSCTLPFSYSSSLPEPSSVNRVWDIKRLTSSYLNSWQKRLISELELDCTADSILNKFDGASSIGKNPGIVAIWKDEMQRRKRTMENFQITPVPTEERNIIETSSEVYYKKELKNILSMRGFSLPETYGTDENMNITNFQTPHSTSKSFTLSGTQDKEILDILFGLCSKDCSTLEIKNNSINDGDEEEDDDKVTHEMSQTCDDNWTSQQSDHMDEFIENSCKFNHEECISQVDGAFDDDQVTFSSQIRPLQDFDQMNELYYNHKAELATQNQLKISQINVAFDKYNTNVILSSQHDLIHIPQLDGMFDIESGSNPVKQGTVKLNLQPCGKRIKRTSLQENERSKHDLKNYFVERNDFRNNTASSLTSLKTENNALLKSKELQENSSLDCDPMFLLENSDSKINDKITVKSSNADFNCMQHKTENNATATLHTKKSCNKKYSENSNFTFESHCKQAKSKDLEKSIKPADTTNSVLIISEHSIVSKPKFKNPAPENKLVPSLKESLKNEHTYSQNNERTYSQKKTHVSSKKSSNIPFILGTKRSGTKSNNTRSPAIHFFEKNESEQNISDKYDHESKDFKSHEENKSKSGISRDDLKLEKKQVSQEKFDNAAINNQKNLVNGDVNENCKTTLVSANYSTIKEMPLKDNVLPTVSSINNSFQTNLITDSQTKKSLLIGNHPLKMKFSTTKKCVIYNDDSNVSACNPTLNLSNMPLINNESNDSDFKSIANVSSVDINHKHDNGGEHIFDTRYKKSKLYDNGGKYFWPLVAAKDCYSEIEKNYPHLLKIAGTMCMKNRKSTPMKKLSLQRKNKINPIKKAAEVTVSSRTKNKQSFNWLNIQAQSNVCEIQGRSNKSVIDDNKTFKSKSTKQNLSISKSIIKNPIDTIVAHNLYDTVKRRNDSKAQCSTSLSALNKVGQFKEKSHAKSCSISKNCSPFSSVNLNASHLNNTLKIENSLCKFEKEKSASEGKKYVKPPSLNNKKLCSNKNILSFDVEKKTSEEGKEDFCSRSEKTATVQSCYVQLNNINIPKNLEPNSACDSFEITKNTVSPINKNIMVFSDMSQSNKEIHSELSAKNFSAENPNQKITNSNNQSNPISPITSVFENHHDTEEMITLTHFTKNENSNNDFSSKTACNKKSQNNLDSNKLSQKLNEKRNYPKEKKKKKSNTRWKVDSNLNDDKRRTTPNQRPLSITIKSEPIEDFEGNSNNQKGHKSTKISIEKSKFGKKKSCKSSTNRKILQNFSMNKNILSCSDKTRKSEFKPHSLENECSNNLSNENELINNHSDTDKDVIFLEENKKSNKLCGRKSTRLVPKHKCEEVVDLSDDDSTNMDKNYLVACNKNSLSPIHSEDSRRKEKLVISFKKNHDCDRWMLGKLASGSGCEKIIKKEPDTESPKTRRSLRARNSSQNSKQTNSPEQVVSPSLRKNIKKEKIDDYQQQQYVKPLRLCLNGTNKVGINRTCTIVEPKCKPLTLCRVNMSHGESQNFAKRKHQNSSYEDPAGNPPKRKRGRPAKVQKSASADKDLSSLKNSTTFYQDISKPSACLVGKKSAAELSIIKGKNLSESRISSGKGLWEVKVKQEPVSDTEDGKNINIMPSQQTNTRSTVSRRRNSLRYENIKKVHDSNHKDVNKVEQKPQKKKVRSKSENCIGIKSIEMSPNSNETLTFQNSMPEVSSNSKINKHNLRSKAPVNYTNFFDDVEVLFDGNNKSPVKKSTGRKRGRPPNSKNRHTSSENNLSCNPRIGNLKRLSFERNNSLRDYQQMSEPITHYGSNFNSTIKGIQLNNEFNCQPESVSIAQTNYLDSTIHTSHSFANKIQNFSNITQEVSSTHLIQEVSSTKTGVLDNLVTKEKPKPLSMPLSTKTGTNPIPESGPVTMNGLHSFDLYMYENTPPEINVDCSSIFSVQSISSPSSLNVPNKINSKTSSANILVHSSSLEMDQCVFGSPMLKNDNMDCTSPLLYPHSPIMDTNHGYHISKFNPDNKYLHHNHSSSHKYERSSELTHSPMKKQEIMFDPCDSPTIEFPITNNKEKLKSPIEDLNRIQHHKDFTYSSVIDSYDESHKCDIPLVDNSIAYNGITNDKQGSLLSEQLGEMHQQNDSCYSFENSPMNECGGFAYASRKRLRKEDKVSNNQNAPLKYSNNNLNGRKENYSENRQSCVSEQTRPVQDNAIKENSDYYLFHNNSSSSSEVKQSHLSFLDINQNNYSHSFYSKNNEPLNAVNNHDYDKMKWENLSMSNFTSSNETYSKNCKSIQSNKYSSCFPKTSHSLTETPRLSNELFYRSTWPETNSPCFSKNNRSVREKPLNEFPCHNNENFQYTSSDRSELFRKNSSNVNFSHISNCNNTPYQRTFQHHNEKKKCASTFDENNINMFLGHQGFSSNSNSENLSPSSITYSPQLEASASPFKPETKYLHPLSNESGGRNLDVCRPSPCSSLSDHVDTIQSPSIINSPIYTSKGSASSIEESKTQEKNSLMSELSTCHMSYNASSSLAVSDPKMQFSKIFDHEAMIITDVSNNAVHEFNSSVNILSGETTIFTNDKQDTMTLDSMQKDSPLELSSEQNNEMESFLVDYDVDSNLPQNKHNVISLPENSEIIVNPHLVKVSSSDANILSTSQKAITLIDFDDHLDSFSNNFDEKDVIGLQTNKITKEESDIITVPMSNNSLQNHEDLSISEIQRSDEYSLLLNNPSINLIDANSTIESPDLYLTLKPEISMDNSITNNTLCYTQSSTESAFNHVNSIDFPLAFPQSNLFNNESIIIEDNSSEKEDGTTEYKNVQNEQENTIPVMDSEEIKNLKKSLINKNDLLSAIMKDTIGEGFDDNTFSPTETTNDANLDQSNNPFILEEFGETSNTVPNSHMQLKRDITTEQQKEKSRRCNVHSSPCIDCGNDDTGEGIFLNVNTSSPRTSDTNAASSLFKNGCHITQIIDPTAVATDISHEVADLKFSRKDCLPSVPPQNYNQSHISLFEDRFPSCSGVESFYGEDSLNDIHSSYNTLPSQHNTHMLEADVAIMPSSHSSTFSNNNKILINLKSLFHESLLGHSSKCEYKSISAGIKKNCIKLKTVVDSSSPRDAIIVYSFYIKDSYNCPEQVLNVESKYSQIRDKSQPGSSPDYLCSPSSPIDIMNLPLMNTMSPNNNYEVKKQSLSPFNLESTPTAERSHTKLSLLKKFPVSPIKGNNFLTDDTKKKRTLSFNCMPEPFEENKRPKILSQQSTNLVENVSSSDIDGPTLLNSLDSQVGIDDCLLSHEALHLTIMSLEVHVSTREYLDPDPKFDPVVAIFYSIYEDVKTLQQKTVGMITIKDEKCEKTLKNYLNVIPGVKTCQVFCVEDEESLFKKLASIVREWDPDVLIGYEIQMASWGYLIERANVFNMNLNFMLSRLCDPADSMFHDGVQKDNNVVTDQIVEVDQIKVTGRIILNFWRLLTKEITLKSYTFEKVYHHVLHRRRPHYSFQDLTRWFHGREKETVVEYYTVYVLGVMQILDKLDILRRTSELARLFGIQFYDVLSRGSQFRVESMMLRIAASMNYIPVSPSVRQRSQSRAPEYIPLILEPESKFYQDPVVVLDFQSLYPSMIIAYNYCFSTCLGRIEHFGKNTPFEFGCTSLCVEPKLLQNLAIQDNIHFSPSGIGFVKAPVRPGILPTMLQEILSTRIMVKQSMKKIKHNNALKKLLDARQLGLKLIANVTYGYTGANFSGRMPCVEVADSIVAKGRETLERAIYLIENTPEWKAKVVYGDTDSLFILLPGRSKEEAFQIGEDMADAVTKSNPEPVKLKFEKVYLPCVLQTKKRYVGFMYETVDQEKPIFDAKGIETVRRDSCPATAKILEKSLKILFQTRNLDDVKDYVQKQFSKILNERANIMDFIFAKEYRGRSGYKPGACVPALEIAKRRAAKDPRSEPLPGERVPYVVVYGPPGLPIIRLVREPDELLNDSNLRINAKYYITCVITPALERVFSLMGANVKSWFMAIIHTQRLNLPMYHSPRITITQYFVSCSCASCGSPATSSLCDNCLQDSSGTIAILHNKIRKWERNVDNLRQVCTSCTKSNSSVDHCVSVDCPVFFKLVLAKKDLSQASYLKKIIIHELF